MNKTFLFASALAMSLTLASCSQEADVIQEKERKTVQQYESVDELTKRLKEYDSKFALRKTPLLSSKNKKRVGGIYLTGAVVLVFEPFIADLSGYGDTFFVIVKIYIIG